MVADLSETSAAGQPLESLLFGGASAPDWLAKQSRKAFPTATMLVFFSQFYSIRV